MKRVQGLAISKMLLAALGVCLVVFVAGTTHASSDLPIFTGKFTLTNQVQWGQTILQPGNYTVIIKSHGSETFAFVRDNKGRAAGIFMSQIDDGKTPGGDTLLLREKGGQLRVYSLALGSLGRMLVYDPVLARQAVLAARAPQTVPVMLAKR